VGSNFTFATSTIDKTIAADANYGSFYRTIYAEIGATTSAPSASVISAQRFPVDIAVPSVGANVEGFIATNCSMISNDTVGVNVIAIEYLLGELDFASTFADGVAMPIKPIKGTNIQTASGLTMLVCKTQCVSSNGSGGGGSLDIEYTDQGNTTLITNTIQLEPSMDENTAFMFQPTAPVDSKGVRDITDITLTATGSPTGTIEIYGLLPIYVGVQNETQWDLNFLRHLMVPYLIEPNETIAAYRFFTVSGGAAIINLGFTPEPV
jgi:hypothetical protein